jgi:hypothetical protein
METLLNIALWVLTILGYVIYNLYSKNVKLEQMIINRDQTLRNLSDIINESDRVLNEVDRIGAFKSDDEIGFFFNTVKAIQDTLNEFSNNN